MLVSCIITVIVLGNPSNEQFIKIPVEGPVIEEYEEVYIADFTEDLQRSGYTLFEDLDAFKEFIVGKNQCVKK